MYRPNDGGKHFDGVASLEAPEKETPEIIPLWSPNSPDLNPLDYSVWGLLQEVYKIWLFQHPPPGHSYGLGNTGRELVRQLALVCGCEHICVAGTRVDDHDEASSCQRRRGL